MAEAVEIAKLRLFLKMVAVVDANRRAPNLGLDPLPDIDFNIRCGNTLVGYATEDEIVQGSSADIFTQHEFREKVEIEMEKVARAYDTFRHIQLSQHEDIGTFKQAKEELKQRLSAFTDLLNHQMFSHTGGGDYNAWLASHQPFHWFAEYYQIIHGNGGFDVIIGNPPYVEYSKVKKFYTLEKYTTLACGNLYAFVIERSFVLGKKYLGFIVPSASIATPRMKQLSSFMLSHGGLWSSIWDERPSKLFDGVDQQLAIHILYLDEVKKYYITQMRHWSASARDTLFNSINYQVYLRSDILTGVCPKVGSLLEMSIIRKISQADTLFSVVYDPNSGTLIYYKNAGGRYWRQVKSYPTYFNSQKGQSSSTELAFSVQSKYKALVVCALSSSMFYLYWRVISNCRHLTSREFDVFRIPSVLKESKEIKSLHQRFEKSLEANKKRTTTVNKSTGETTQDFYYLKLSKRIIDEIDKVLAKHYDFTEEELDFIINYDIKYRMGDELNEV